jgi:NAD(P)-dependent dehydrogenase (short-subunit alcohol dehydrogenase family)
MTGCEAIFVPTDVTQAADVAAAIGSAIDAFGKIDYAFNNAGSEADGILLAAGAPDLYDEIMEVNVKGVWLCMREEITVMMAAGGGTIVNTASVGGLVGSPDASIYSASKHAVVAPHGTYRECKRSGG